MSRARFDAGEVAAIERALEATGLARVNPMLGGGVVFEALATRARVEAALAPLGLGASWDPSGPFGDVTRPESTR